MFCGLRLRRRPHASHAISACGGRLLPLQQLAELREKIGDTGKDFPECETIFREFWDYDAADRAKAEQISHDFLANRQAELARRKK